MNCECEAFAIIEMPRRQRKRFDYDLEAKSLFDLARASLLPRREKPKLAQRLIALREEEQTGSDRQAAINISFVRITLGARFITKPARSFPAITPVR